MQVRTDPWAGIHDLPHPEKFQREAEQARADYRAQADIVLAKINALVQASTRHSLAFANLSTVIAEPTECERRHCCPGCDWHHTAYDNGHDEPSGWQCRRSSDKSRWRTEEYDG